MTGRASLRDFTGPEPAPPRSLAAAIDDIMRRPAQATPPAHTGPAAPADGRTVLPMGSQQDSKRRTEQQIASLKLDGIEQVTDAEFRVMTPEQIVRAREEGRLLALMTTPARDDGAYRTSTAG